MISAGKDPKNRFPYQLPRHSHPYHLAMLGLKGKSPEKGERVLGLSQRYVFIRHTAFHCIRQYVKPLLSLTFPLHLLAPLSLSRSIEVASAPSQVKVTLSRFTRFNNMLIVRYCSYLHNTHSLHSFLSSFPFHSTTGSLLHSTVVHYI